MKWPWVSRSIYDLAVAQTNLAIAQTAEAIRMAERANELTTVAFTTLDRIAAPRPVPEGHVRNPLPLATPERNDVTEAIELASGNDRGLARHLTRWAKQQALDGMKEREIIQSILHWPRATEWDGEPDDVPEPLW